MIGCASAGPWARRCGQRRYSSTDVRITASRFARTVAAMDWHLSPSAEGASLCKLFRTVLAVGDGVGEHRSATDLLGEENGRRGRGPALVGCGPQGAREADDVSERYVVLSPAVSTFAAIVPAGRRPGPNDRRCGCPAADLSCLRSPWLSCPSSPAWSPLTTH